VVKKVLVFIVLILPFYLLAQNNSGKTLAEYLAIYEKLHAQPELSGQEKNTATFLRKCLQEWGYQITDSLGFYSFAAVLKNGKGPTIMYRTDMDALPVKEQTQLPFSSSVVANKDGVDVPVMHACGHDVHMVTWLAVADYFAHHPKEWKGTLVLLAQSAEEIGQGARKAIAQPNFNQLPQPNYQIAMHNNADLTVGQVGFCDGYAMAAVDMMNIIIHGKGGHGAVPQNTIDPIVLAAQFVTEIQTIVSRNLPPIEAAVVTVGAIHGGTIGNVIPNQVELKLTIRSFSPQARQLILDRLKTIGDGLASAAGLPQSLWPEYQLLDMSIAPVFNDSQMGKRVAASLKKKYGEKAIVSVDPVMIGEDFGMYRTDPNIPSYLLWMGTLTPASQQKYTAQNQKFPSLHSPNFAPDYQESLPQSIQMMTTALQALFTSH
jgi:hippurate hydrolase